MKGWMPAAGVLLVVAGVALFALNRPEPPAVPVLPEAAPDFALVQNLAAELGAKLDAGQWDELGFDE